MPDYPFTPEQLCLLHLATSTWERRGAAKRHRLPYGEETITATILLDLADGYPGEVTMVSFNRRQEARIGADWAWAFQSGDGKWTLPMLVQAKLLDSEDHAYPEIERRIGRSSVRQIDRLISTAEGMGWPSLYAFYNHLDDVSRIPANCRSLEMTERYRLASSWGISIADAYSVRAARRDLTFDTHRRHSIPLHCLLCSMGTGDRGPSGSPGWALDALQQLRGRSAPVVDDSTSPLPDEPMREEPPLIRQARELSNIGDMREKSAVRDMLAQQFPNIAGVVIFRDGRSD